ERGDGNPGRTIFHRSVNHGEDRPRGGGREERAREPVGAEPVAVAEPGRPADLTGGVEGDEGEGRGRREDREAGARERRGRPPGLRESRRDDGSEGEEAGPEREQVGRVGPAVEAEAKGAGGGPGERGGL